MSVLLRAFTRAISPIKDGHACAILTVGSTGTLQNYNIPWGGLIKAGSAMKVLITRMQKVLSFPATMSSVSNQLLFLLCSYLVV